MESKRIPGGISRELSMCTQFFFFLGIWRYDGRPAVLGTITGIYWKNCDTSRNNPESCQNNPESCRNNRKSCRNNLESCRNK